MKTLRVIIGFSGLVLITAGCELGNQPVYYGGDILLNENFNGYNDYAQPEDWDFVDDLETSNGPSDWYVYNTFNDAYKRALSQWSDIGGGGFGNTQYYGTTAFIGNESWTDYGFEVDFLTSDNDGLGFDFRHIAEPNPEAGYYRLLFIQDALNGGPFVKLIYYSYSQRQAQVLAERNDITYEPDPNWNHLKITVIGSNIQCELNNLTLFNVTDMRLTKGRIGLFCCYMDLGVFFDNVLVTALDEGSSPNGNSLVD